MTFLTEELTNHWAFIEPLLRVRDEAEYDAAVARLNALLDEIGTDKGHPLYELLDTLGSVIHAYEEQHYLFDEGSAADMLHFLMEEHRLRQSDLPEIGSQGVVSEILSSRRELNTRQIRALAERFRVSPAVFF